ncbi:MAG: hypothetical protein P8Z00_24260 [Anaerolineales bacterium]
MKTSLSMPSPTSWLVPTRRQLWEGVRLFGMILLGGLLLSPLVARLPVLGWDWYFFIYRNNPDFNILGPNSAYPPYAPIFLDALTWMDWRTSLAILNSLTLVTVAVATWRNGGKYGSIVLALFTPPFFYLFWTGLPDGLSLLGLITGFVPLALIKPQLTFFSMFGNKKLLAWTVIFLVLSLIIWPLWPLKLGQASFGHSAAFGWEKAGWPVLVLGLLLLAGAGKHTYRLMAAGLLISPFLMPYNFSVLLPVIGEARGWRKVVIWAFAWLTLLGVGMPWPVKYLNLLFPIAAYCLTHSWSEYLNNLGALADRLKQYSRVLFYKLRQA